MARHVHSGLTAMVAAPCPQGDWDCVKAPGRGWELTKQLRSSLWDWKELPGVPGQPDVRETGQAA